MPKMDAKIHRLPSSSRPLQSQRWAQLVAALLGILPSIALGQIHKPATGGASVYPDATAANDYYDVRGTTVADLRREIQGKGPEGSRDAQDEWDSIFRTLDLHERGHVRISLEGARELERTLREISPVATCALIDAEAKSRFDAVTSIVHRRQATYDNDTDHGRKQWSPYRQ